MKITIMGTPGSGKSTLADDLAKALNMKHYKVGDMRREIAKKHGMTLAEMNKLGETEAWTDTEVDDYVKKIGQEEDNFIMDSNTAWFFIPNSVKVFLDAGEELRAKRMTKRKLVEENFYDIKQAIKANRERIESNKKRYAKYYGFDPYDKSQFDILLDSTGQLHEETLNDLLQILKEKKLLKE